MRNKTASFGGGYEVEMHFEEPGTNNQKPKTKNQYRVMTLKFNWGYGIAMVYTGFALGMLFLVYLCTTYKVDLVQPDYYNQELAYQQRIDQKSNTAALTQKLEIVYNRDAQNVHIQLPQELTGTQTMNLRFYRPDDSSLDKKLHQPVSISNDISVSTAGMKAGLWRLEMSWTHGTKNYFQETVLNF